MHLGRNVKGVGHVGTSEINYGGTCDLGKVAEDWDGAAGLREEGWE